MRGEVFGEERRLDAHVVVDEHQKIAGGAADRVMTRGGRSPIRLRDDLYGAAESERGESRGDRLMRPVVDDEDLLA
jgi:hypothetical protein